MMTSVRSNRIINNLADAVARRCEAEWAERGLQDRLPLRVTVGGQIEIRDERLAELVAARPADRLIVVGDAGAGKTALAIGLVRELLIKRGPEDPVPIYAPVSTWRPEQPLHDWLAAQVGGVSAPALRELAARGRLLLVLDGLGESSQPSARQVLHGLHRDLTDADGLILTCRRDAYPQLLASGAPLARTILSTVQPVPASDASAWLASTQRSRWAPVIAELTARPTGSVAEALSTPEVIRLAVSAYDDNGDPSEMLTRATSRSAVEEHLVERFHSRLDLRADTRRWLGFLARHQHHTGTRDLAWWRLAAAVPEAVRGFFAQFGAGLLVASALGLATGSALGFWFGLGFGLTFGIQGWPSDGHGGAIAWRATIVAMFALALSAVNHPLAGVAVAGIVGSLAWWGYGWRMGLGIGLATLVAAGVAAIVDVNAAWAALVGTFLAFTSGIAFWAVFVGARVRPARLDSRPPRGMRSFGLRFVAGFAASLPATFIIALVGWAGVVVALAVGTAAGLAAGLTVWHDAPGGMYRERPATSLKHDRAAALIGGLANGVVIGFGIWLALDLFTRFPRVTAYTSSEAVPVGIAVGLVVAIATTLSRSWGGFLLARLWFGLTRRLPGRIMTFLGEMYRAGVLIESGGSYQFRFGRHEERLRQTAR
jgi:NACHT domain